MQAQTDFYDQLKTEYDLLRKEKKHDSALVVAKQMNDWSLKNETDTSLRYAVSLRYVGNCFYSLDFIDSATIYFNRSYEIAKKMGVNGQTDALKVGYNLALSHYYNSDKVSSEKILLEISEIDTSANSIENLEVALLLGSIYYETKKYNESLSWNLKALKFIKLKYTEYSENYVNQEYLLAGLFNDLNRYSQSLIYYSDAARILKEIGKQTSELYFAVIQDYALCAQEAGDLILAQILHNEALSFYDSNTVEYADCLNNMASFQLKIGAIVKADSCFKVVLDIYMHSYSPNSVDIADCLNNIGVNYLDLSDYENARNYLFRAKNIYSNELNEGSQKYLDCINNIGLFYQKINDFNAAQEIYREALSLITTDTLYLAVVTQNLSTLYTRMGCYNEAENLLLECKILLESYSGDKVEEYARGLNILGALYFEINQFEKAGFYYEKALEYYLKSYGGFSLDYAQVLENLANNSLACGEIGPSEKLLLQVLSIAETLVGERHSFYADVMQSLGLFYAETNQFSKAKMCLERSMEIRFSNYGKNNLDYAMSLLNIGVFHSSIGDFDLGYSYFNDALNIYIDLLGKNHIELALVYYNIGNSMYVGGKYKLAEENYLEANRIMQKCYGDEHSDYARCELALGDLYLAMGNNELAENKYQTALQKFKIIYGSSHPIYANALTSLAFLQSETNRIQEAESNYLVSMNIIEKSYGLFHSDYCSLLANYGLILHAKSDFQGSIKLFNSALSILDSLYDEGYIDIANVYINLARTYTELDDLDKSGYYYLKAMNIYRINNINMNHPDYFLLLGNLGDFHNSKSELDSARYYYDLSMSSKIYHLSKGFAWLSQTGRMHFWKTNIGFFDEMVQFSIENDISTYLAYNANLISKSLLLETSRELDHAIAQSSDVEMKAQFAEMKQLRRAYNKMQSEGSDKNDIMERFNAQTDSLDKILVNKLGEYAASKRKFEITWKDIQSNITSTEAAIEFARYYDDKDSAYKYLALVVRPGYDYPKLVKLGKEEDILSANQPKGQDFATLYDLVWRSVDSLLTGVNTVYYSPAGELNNLAFSALCFEAGDSLVSSMTAQNRGVVIEMEGASSRSCKAVLMDKYTLHQITTTRYLADGTLKKERILNSTITLLGGINYTDLPATVKDVEHEESEQDFALNVNLTNRNNEKKSNRSSSGIGKPMDYLEGTRAEVTHIATQLNGSWSVQTLSDRNASEHSLKSQMERTIPGVLHIATHGFAFPDEAKKESKLMEMNQTSTYKVSEDPMVRCGLMLSGSNISWTGNPKKMIEQTGDDGILTAAEVANLDLSNTKLVVLSACETGLGKIEGSEGTFGLKRGFKLAGVEQMIVSLWSVPDKETMELMTLFYTDLTKTLNPVISFEKAQKEMRKKYPTQPEKWAGFVLVR